MLPARTASTGMRSSSSSSLSRAIVILPYRRALQRPAVPLGRQVVPRIERISAVVRAAAPDAGQPQSSSAIKAAAASATTTTTTTAAIAAAAATAAVAVDSPSTSTSSSSPALLIAAAGSLAVWSFISSPGGAPVLAAAAAVAAQLGGKLAVTGAAARAAWAGAAAGCLHTLSGPDHLAALTPLTIGRSHAAAAALGGLWGFGHCVGQAVLGLAMVLLKDRFASLVPSLARWGSATVGGTLLAIGCLGLFETYQAHSESAAEAAEAEREAEAEAEALLVSSSGNSGSSKTAGFLGARGRFSLWTLATGVVYGLQPDALFVVVPALALPTKAAAASYMCAFVLGTVGAMGSYAAVIGATSRAIISSGGGDDSGANADADDSALQKRKAQAKLSGAASLVAVGVGLAVLASAAGVNLPIIGGAGTHAH